jgi:hypothetical protein
MTLAIAATAIAVAAIAVAAIAVAAIAVPVVAQTATGCRIRCPIPVRDYEIGEPGSPPKS